MKCECGEKMKRHERMNQWEKQRFWKCPKCGVVRIIPRSEEKEPK